MDSYDNEWALLDDDLFCVWSFCEFYKTPPEKDKLGPKLRHYEPLNPDRNKPHDSHQSFTTKGGTDKWRG